MVIGPQLRSLTVAGEITKDVRVVVVGGGAAGLSTAVELAKLGCATVILIERDLIISKSSGLSTGVFTRQYVDPLDIELRVKAYEHVEMLERTRGITFRRIGYMRLGRDDATVASFERGLEILRGLGVHDSRILDPTGINEAVPGMRTDDLVGALYSPTDGYLDGHHLCQIYAEQATELGVQIRQRCGLVGATGGTGEPFILETTNGSIEADIVVNAAGAWASDVGAMLGAPVAGAPVREQVCLGKFSRPLGFTMPFVMDYVVGDAQPGLWIRDDGNDHFLAGLHSNEPLEPPVRDPDDFVKTVDQDFVEEVAVLLLDRYGALPGLGLKAGWAGLYPMSPDGSAIVGPHPDAPQVVAVAGLGGVGIMLSPIVGRLAAEWIVHGEPRAVADAKRLRPTRFAEV